MSKKGTRKPKNPKPTTPRPKNGGYGVCCR